MSAMASIGRSLEPFQKIIIIIIFLFIYLFFLLFFFFFAHSPAQ